MRNILFSFFLIIIVGCSESVLDPNSGQLGLDYFPLETGQFRIYQVEEINFSVLGSDTSTFELKESVIDSFPNAENQLTYILHRSSRANDTEQWTLDSVWTARITNKFAVQVENNRSIVKLTFPVENGVQWDGNGLNGRNEKLFKYDLSVRDTTLFETQFSDVAKVIQSDIPEGFTGRDERYEIYAENVGLIIKNSIILAFCQQECPEEKTIESGRIFRAALIEYGKE